jgi:hypothetical protein
VRATPLVLGTPPYPVYEETKGLFIYAPSPRTLLEEQPPVPRQSFAEPMCCGGGSSAALARYSGPLGGIAPVVRQTHVRPRVRATTRDGHYVVEGGSKAVMGEAQRVRPAATQVTDGPVPDVDGGQRDGPVHLHQTLGSTTATT